MTNRPPRALIAWFLGIPLLLYGTLVLIPAVNAFRYSFTRWDGLSDPVWVGTKNFRTIFSQASDFIAAFLHNVYLMFVPGVFILTLALFFAYTIHRGIKGGRLFRIAFFFPNVISSVAIAILWIYLYSPGESGLLNGLLKHTFGQAVPAWLPVIGGEKLPIPFTASDRLIPNLTPMIVWTATGFYMVLFLAAMENIPESYYEAAKLDGASNARMFFT